MSYSLKNDEIYNQTLDFIFSLDKNSNILDKKMIQSLFELFEIKNSAPITMKYFETYYNNTNLTKNVLKQKDQSEVFDENYIKNEFKNYSENNKLNINLLFKDMQKINPDLKLDDFQNYINNNIFKNSSNTMDNFYQYTLNLLK